MPTRCIEDLVFDVGTYTGEDTAYYLHKGYRVVAVEANPELVARAGRRFHAAIVAGRLTILGMGVAAEAGTAEFFVSRKRGFWGLFDRGIWSSFNREAAAKDGSRCRSVRVPCVPFREIIAAQGVPYYLKVDIEGNDGLCIRDLASPALPRFVSFEMSHATGNEEIAALADLGYGRFKCVRQNDFAVIGPGEIANLTEQRRRMAAPGLPGSAARLLQRLRRRVLRPRDGRWVFARGSSGPFGESLPGCWLTTAEVLGVWQTLRQLDREITGVHHGEWFDIHAAL